MANYAGHAIPWQLQIPLFLAAFVVTGLICAIPNDTFPHGLLLNDALENFGVFLLFTALWCGIYAHVGREINLFSLVVIFAVALCQEELNIWNWLLRVIGEPLGYVMTSRERQRGDVFMLTLVFASLLLRLVLQKDFRSFFRIHITFFLVAFTMFQILIHYVFAYQFQSAILDQRLNYLREVAVTAADRSDYLCRTEQLTCFTFRGSPPAHITGLSTALKGVLDLSSEAPLYATNWIEVIQPSDDITRGVNATQKVLFALFHENEENRLVIDRSFATHTHNLVAGSLLTYYTLRPRLVFWGMFLVLFHQNRVYRRKYGAEYRRSVKACREAQAQ